jgi:hypothetical protein
LPLVELLAVGSQATQLGVAPPMHTGVAAAHAPLVVSALLSAELQSTQVCARQPCAVDGQCGLRPLLSCESMHATQVWCTLSQAGVAPLQSASTLQPKQVPLLQTGLFGSLQSWFTSHCAQIDTLPVVWQAGVGAAQSRLVPQPWAQVPAGVQSRPFGHCALLAHFWQTWLEESQCGVAGVALQSASLEQPETCAQQPLWQLCWAGHCAEVVQLGTPGSQPRGPWG